MGPLSAAGAPDPLHARLTRQATELEGVFLATLVKEMFAGLDARSAYGGGFAEETWRGLQAEQLGAAMAEAGGVGLAGQLMSDLLSVQEAAGKGV
jgi:Rod binding domain-containing protein